MPVRPGEPRSAEERARVDDAPSAADGHPLAGYHNGLFYLRDHHDNFHLYIQGRSQIDFYSYLGAGVPETSLKPTLFVRRIRPEVTGEFLGRWRFMIAGDFGATAIDNPRGTNEASAAPPGVAPTASTARYGSGETTRFQAAATDVFLNYRQAGLFNVMIRDGAVGRLSYLKETPYGPQELTLDIRAGRFAFALRRYSSEGFFTLDRDANHPLQSADFFAQCLASHDPQRYLSCFLHALLTCSGDVPKVCAPKCSMDSECQGSCPSRASCCVANACTTPRDGSPCPER